MKGDFTVDGAGSVYVPANWFEWQHGSTPKAGVFVFGADGRYLRTIEFAMQCSPEKIAVDSNGNILVLSLDAAYLKGREKRCFLLHKFTKQGILVGSFSACPMASQNGKAEFAVPGAALSALREEADRGHVLANLLNLAAVGKPGDALAALEGFEQRFARCPPAVGQALRERIVALRQLKQLGEARRVVEQYLKTDPERAGPVMVRLLEAMHAEVADAADRDDSSTVREIADEAANLARSLLDWSRAHEGRISPLDQLTIAIWRAAAVLLAGRAEEALGLYDDCAGMADRLNEEHKSQHIEIRLGRAESLLAIGKPADALPLFAALGRELSEESPAWWRALAGQLQCHTALEHDPLEILRAIEQRRFLAPELGGPRIRRMLESIDKTNRSRLPPTTPSR